MKTALLAAIGGILMFTCISTSADAHQAHAVHDVRPQDYMAQSQRQLNTLGFVESAVLRGPADDPDGTATGGPSGGLPDRN